MKRIKDKRLAAIWRNTHRDFRGTFEDGTRTVLMGRVGQGTCLVPLEQLTEDEIADKLRLCKGVS